MNYEKLLKKKYIELCIEERDYNFERLSLPMGYLQKKIIKGKEYYYLQYRIGKQVKTDYVKKTDIEAVSTAVNRRKEIENKLLDIKREKKTIETLADRDSLFIEYIRDRVKKVVKDYPEIKRIILFGSRANSTYREDSDVDLLFESTKPVSLLRQSEIRLALEKEIGLSVDLVHGPLKKDSFLEVDKEIELYAA